MAHIRARFTILGESGSGKTCYLLGMYNAMLSDIVGYSLASNNEEERTNLRKRYSQLTNNENGNNSFPPITAFSENFDFRLTYAFNEIISFSWIDYPGGYVDPTVNNPNSEDYQSVVKNINNSDMLFICVDGKNLIEGDTQAKIRAVRDKSARNINPFISNFVQQNGILPPIIMIVTKSDLLQNVKDDELREIIQGAFTPFFRNQNSYVAVIPVSLGANIADNDYTGVLDPVNVHLPILLGVKIAMLNKIIETQTGLQAAENAIKSYNEDLDKIRNKKQTVEAENKREQQKWWGFRNGKYVAQLSGRLQDYEDAIQNTAQQIAQNTLISNDLRKIAESLNENIKVLDDELLNVKLIYSNGQWQNVQEVGES